MAAARAAGAALPRWAESIRRKYIGGEASMFILHRNVFDEILHGDELYSLVDFLSEVLLKDNKDTIIVYDPSAGVRYAKRTSTLGTEPVRPNRAPEDALADIEHEILQRHSAALIVSYASSIAPPGEENFLAHADRMAAIRLHRWSLSPELESKDNVVFLLSESLAELNAKLVANPRVAAIEIPLPDADERAAVIRKADPAMPADDVARLAAHGAGLRAVQIAQLLTPRSTDNALGERARLELIRSLLGASADAEQRAGKLAALTRGMDTDEIRHLINPDHPLPETDAGDPYAAVVELVHRRKREIIEKECAGLIEFVEARHGLDAVGGNDGIKQELLQIAAAIRSGDRHRAPMGLLFVGPMGTGKTFVAKAFVKESGLSAVTLKNFRSKWVGSTEANLEKVLGMVKALGPIILIIDEGDRSFGGASEDSDGGTSSRVIARLKEFMSEPDNRGQVLFILMTNRPDKLDIDIKRAGRIDRKIPFFHPDTAEDVEAGAACDLRALPARRCDRLGRRAREHEREARRLFQCRPRSGLPARAELRRRRQHGRPRLLRARRRRLRAGARCRHARVHGNAGRVRSLAPQPAAAALPRHEHGGIQCAAARAQARAEDLM
ncbi:ATP-binding protein [Tahibacter sp. UC22_41]|uniref:ATP-binding protein n=1 Tax=Tahibacter sp. UC22_41 TaxID=3350178 RepID=UPI0036DC061D